MLPRNAAGIAEFKKTTFAVVLANAAIVVAAKRQFRVEKLQGAFVYAYATAPRLGNKLFNIARAPAENIKSQGLVVGIDIRDSLIERPVTAQW